MSEKLQIELDVESLKNGAEAFDHRLRDLQRDVDAVGSAVGAANARANDAIKATTASRDTELRIRCLMIASGGMSVTADDAHEAVAAAKTMMKWLQEGE